MTAFVLGSTGFVGREVVRQLCVRRATAIAHVRPDSPRLAEWTERFRALGATVDASPWKITELAAKIREVSAQQVYILIGTTRARARLDDVKGDIYEAIDLGLTQLAVDAVKQARIGSRIIYLSSIGADPTSRSAYLRARGKAEAIVQKSGHPWAIARPSLILGDRDEPRLGSSAAAFVSDAMLALASLAGGKRLRAHYRSTTQDVLASALIRIGEAPDHDRIYAGDDLR